jgi:hypothetical protein
MFGTKANFCFYTELLFCPKCMSPDGRIIPWRVVQDLDDSPRPVSKAAAAYIDSVAKLPMIALSAVAPSTLTRSPYLTRIQKERARLADLIETVVLACRNYDRQQKASSILEDDDLGSADGVDASVRDALLEELNEFHPSAAPPPLMAAINESENASEMLALCKSEAARCLGQQLAFMVETVEMLPLSIIALVSTEAGGGRRVLPRLAAAINAVNEVGQRYGLLDASATYDQDETSASEYGAAYDELAE